LLDKTSYVQCLHEKAFTIYINFKVLHVLIFI